MNRLKSKPVGLVEELVFSEKPFSRISRHLLYWFCWVLLFTFIYGTKPALTDEVVWWGVNRSYWITLLEILPKVLNLALATYLMIYLIIPRYYESGHWLKLAVGVLLTIFLAGATELFILETLQPVISLWFGFAPSPAPAPVVYAYTNILKHGAAVVGFASAIRLFKRWWSEREINRQLQEQNLRIKLLMLRQQLHPHFLFNTLNNLYGLVLEKSDRAGEVVVKLSDLLSYMLYECNEPLNLLEKEIGVIRSYLLLEQLRFEDRLDLSFSVKGDCKGKRIPPLLLLPFLENSFKHGVTENLESPWVNLQLEVKDEHLHVWLANGKTSDRRSPGVSSGIGLRNASKRLKLLYGDSYHLEVSETADSYCVKLSVPLNDHAIEERSPILLQLSDR